MTEKTLYKNDRYNRFCKGMMLFNTDDKKMVMINPIGVTNSIYNIGTTGETPIILHQLLDTSGNQFVYDMNSTDWLLSAEDWTAVTFGGQVGGFILHDENHLNIYIGFVLGTFDYGQNTSFNLDISNMVSVVDELKIYGGVRYGFYAKTSTGDVKFGTPPITGYSSDSRRIYDVEIIDIETIQNKSIFGNKNQVYESYNTYNVTFRIPQNTDIKIVNMLLESNSSCFVPYDVDVYEYVNTNNTYFKKPIGGGSINPIFRDVSIKQDSIKISDKTASRLGYDIQGVING